jgi:error-prone DNA polymerase
VFAELFAKTNYSFLEGASHPEEMVIIAHRRGLKAIGITDRNGVYGVPRAHAAAETIGFPLVIGAQVEIASGGSVFLLAKSRQGYGNLCELLTLVHCRVESKDDPKVLAWAEIFEKSEELIVCLPAPEVESHPVEEVRWSFRQRCYLVVSSFLDGKDRLQKEAGVYFGKKYDLPIVASNQPLFHSTQRKPLQDVLTSIKHTCTLKTAGFRLLPNAERVIKSAEQMKALFPEHPEWVEQSVAISEQCHFSLKEIRYHYPTEWIPDGETGDSYLAKQVWKGAKKRYPAGVPPEVSTQIEKELELIRDLAYSDYFLTIWDIVTFAQSRQILYQGRGSAANSVVCYLLGITAIDPIRMELLFERFISRERKEPPDIDIDFEHERREEVIQYIYDRYGRHRAAITAEVICYRRKSSLREVAKVFDIPIPIIEKLLVFTHRRELSQVSIAELEAAIPEYPATTLKQYYALASEILSFPRHLGTHVGGFVLCHDQLSRNVPIEKAAMEGRTIIQWDKNDLDALGFVRVDILGLGILTCIRKAFDGVRNLYGTEMTLANVPAEDPKIYDSMCLGDTVGVFQIESRAQMNMLPRLKPRTFFDLVVEISLVRPGPIQGEMVHPYLRRRAGLEPVEYAHPELKAILKKTYGVPLFQEQIMKMAMVVAGFSAGEADELRRAMGTWRRHGHSRLAKMGEKFCQGLVNKGIDRAFAEKVFSQIEGFAEYGFPESHAASFAILAYASAYLRYYYPDVFLCAILNAQPMGFYGTQTLVHDGERHGVRMFPIDVNYSAWDNTCPEKRAVRLGIREIKGFPERTGRAIETARAHSPFSTLLDLVTRVKEALAPQALTKRELFFLAGANALESMGLDRRRAFWEIQALPIQDCHILPTLEEKIKLPAETNWEKILNDYEAQGVSLHAHPLAHFRSWLDARGALNSQFLKFPAAKFVKSKRKITVGGMVISRQMPPTASGVLFITLEDEFGFINLVIWNKVYQQYREVLITQSFLLCEGHVEKAQDGDVIHVIVNRVAPLISSSPTLTSSHDFR